MVPWFQGKVWHCLEPLWLATSLVYSTMPMGSHLAMVTIQPTAHYAEMYSPQWALSGYLRAHFLSTQVFILILNLKLSLYMLLKAFHPQNVLVIWYRVWRVYMYVCVIALMVRVQSVSLGTGCL